MAEFAVLTPGGEKIHVAAHNLPRVGEDLALPDPDTGRSIFQIPSDQKVYRVVHITHPTKEASERASHLGIHVPLVRVRPVPAVDDKECTCVELYNSGGGTCKIHGKIS